MQSSDVPEVKPSILRAALDSMNKSRGDFLEQLRSEFVRRVETTKQHPNMDVVQGR